MTNIANDLRIEGRIANDLYQSSEQLILRHPAAMMAAARVERSREIARLFGLMVKAVTRLFGARKKEEAAVQSVKPTVANANIKDNHQLAA